MTVRRGCRRAVLVYNNHVIHFGAFGDFHIPLAKLSMGEKSTLVSNFHLTPNLQLLFSWSHIWVLWKGGGANTEITVPGTCVVLCCVCSLSCVWLFVTPWTVACQAPLSMRFSRQEYWSGVPFPSLGYLPHPGIKPRSPALHTDSLLSETPGHYSLYREGERSSKRWGQSDQ